LSSQSTSSESDNLKVQKKIHQKQQKDQNQNRYLWESYKQIAIQLANKAEMSGFLQAQPAVAIESLRFTTDCFSSIRQSCETFSLVMTQPTKPGRSPARTTRPTR